MAITLVNTTRITGSASGTIASTTAGNCLFVVYMGDKGNQTSGTYCITSACKLGGVVDNFTNIVSGFTLQVYDTAGTHSGSNCSIWVDPICAGGQTTIAITGTNLTDNFFVVYEVAGMYTPTVDLHLTFDSGTGAPTTWTTGTTGTSAAAAEFVIGMTSHGPNTGSGETLADTTPGAPWTDVTYYNSNPGIMGICGYQISTTTQTFVYSGTSSKNDYYDALLMTFVPGTPPVQANVLELSGPIQQLPRPKSLTGRAYHRAGAPVSTPGPPVTALDGPVRATLPGPRRYGRQNVQSNTNVVMYGNTITTYSMRSMP